MISLPSKPIRIVEVGPRDGLQNERQLIDTKTKIKLIENLVEAGLSHIEVGAFVSPRWVPQMAGTDAVVAGLKETPNVRFSALVPNQHGLEAALDTILDEVAVFTAASESFTQKNINCTIDESIERFASIATAAKQQGLKLRGYVSCAIACPYEGTIAPEHVADVAAKLYALGCDEISLGDTIGVGTPLATQRMIASVAERVPTARLALHPHDTYGQALANVLAALEGGVSTFDSSIAGLGGCPYAPGACGNLATEDLVFMFDGMGIETGINLNRLAQIGLDICASLGRTNRSKVGQAFASKERSA